MREGVEGSVAGSDNKMKGESDENDEAGTDQPAEHDWQGLGEQLKPCRREGTVIGIEGEVIGQGLPITSNEAASRIAVTGSGGKENGPWRGVGGDGDLIGLSGGKRLEMEGRACRCGWRLQGGGQRKGVSMGLVGHRGAR